MTKFNVGDKVVPISKTVDWNTLNRVKDHLNESGTWNRALSNEQPYLYVNSIDKFRNLYICSNECGGGGDYFHESDLTPYKTKSTKNQRITALENEVAELKLIVHELRDGRKTMRDVMNEVLSEPSTIAVEDIIEFEGQQYRKVDREVYEGDVIVFYGSRHSQITDGKPYKVFKGENIEENKLSHTADSGTEYPVDGEYVDGYYVYELIEGGLNPQILMVDETIEPLTQNQQRAAIIEKAKKFVNENKSKYRSEWNIVGHTVQILIYDSNGMLMMFRQAKCNPSDVFNEHIGKTIALGRALGLDVSEFEQAVQPTVEVGQIVEDTKPALGINASGRVRALCKGALGSNGYRTENGKWSHIETVKIINDSNAKYEVES